jgi:hypothetical protein
MDIFAKLDKWVYGPKGLRTVMNRDWSFFINYA